MKPAKRILDREFVYVPSHLTSVTATWLRFGWRPIAPANAVGWDVKERRGPAVQLGPHGRELDAEMSGKSPCSIAVAPAAAAPRVIPIKERK